MKNHNAEERKKQPKSCVDESYRSMQKISGGRILPTIYGVVRGKHYKDAPLWRGSKISFNVRGKSGPACHIYLLASNPPTKLRGKCYVQVQ